METVQIAVGGFLGILALGIIQFIINSYMQKSERLKNKEIEDLVKKVESICTKLDLIQTTLTSVTLQYELLKQEFKQHCKEFNEHKSKEK